MASDETKTLSIREAEERDIELKAAVWEPCGTIENVSDEGEHWVIMSDTNMGLSFRKDQSAVEPEVGQTFEHCGGTGYPVQGVKLGGQLAFFKTKQDLADDRQKMLADMALARKAEYEVSKDVWRKEMDALPASLKARMERFVAEAGGFEPFFLDGGSYELFCCTEAVKFAEYFKRLFEEQKLETPEERWPAVVAFTKLEHDEKRRLVPFSREHSGNTWHGSVRLGYAVVAGVGV